MDDKEKIKMVIDWYERNNKKDLDVTFVFSLQERLDFFGSLTFQQRKALDNIIAKLDIK